MEERRKFTRLSTKEKTFLDKEGGNKQEGSLVDISPGGMKIICDNEVKVGSVISGQFKILPNVGPFYIRGEVAWVKPVDDKTGPSHFEIGIKFNKVSTIPI
jgi:hypothetical protein